MRDQRGTITNFPIVDPMCCVETHTAIHHMTSISRYHSNRNICIYRPYIAHKLGPHQTGMLSYYYQYIDAKQN